MDLLTKKTKFICIESTVSGILPLRSDKYPDPYQSKKHDPDPYQSEKHDPDPFKNCLDPQHCRKISEQNLNPRETTGCLKTVDVLVLI